MKLTYTLLLAAYQSVLREYPFSSATPVLKVAGRPTHPALGGNCIDQSAELKRRLDQFEGVTVQVLQETRHHALLVTVDDETYYTDAYFMMRTPLRLETGRLLGMEAYPKVDDRFSEVCVQYDGQSLKVSKYILGTSLIESAVMLIGGDLPTGESYRQIAMHDAMASLSIRVMLSGVLFYIGYPLKPIRPADPNNIFIRIPDGSKIKPGEPGFSQYLRMIEGVLRVSSSTIVEHLLEAATSYHRLVGEK